MEQLGVSGVLVLDAPATGPAGKAVSLFFILINEEIHSYESRAKCTKLQHRFHISMKTTSLLQPKLPSVFGYAVAKIDFE